MTKYIVIYLPERDEKVKWGIASKWIDRLFLVGAKDVRILNPTEFCGTNRLECKIKLSRFNDLDKLNNINSPEGSAIYMTKKTYKNYKGN